MPRHDLIATYNLKAIEAKRLYLECNKEKYSCKARHSDFVRKLDSEWRQVSEIKNDCAFAAPVVMLLML